MREVYQALRGGSWYGYPLHARVADRIWLTPGYRNRYLGLRIARAPLQRMAT